MQTDAETENTKAVGPRTDTAVLMSLGSKLLRIGGGLVDFNEEAAFAADSRDGGGKEADQGRDLELWAHPYQINSSSGTSSLSHDSPSSLSHVHLATLSLHLTLIDTFKCQSCQEMGHLAVSLQS
jgi:hypothetical protein